MHENIAYIENFSRSIKYYVSQQIHKQMQFDQWSLPSSDCDIFDYYLYYLRDKRHTNEHPITKVIWFVT